MAFTDFTHTKKVKELFPETIVRQKEFLPPNFPPFHIENSFENDIKFSVQVYHSSEAFAERFLISPIINKVWQQHKKLNVWSQTFIKADDKLQGRPDFLVSPVYESQFNFLSLPLLVSVEAKQENFAAGWGQCLAEMIACQKLNNNHHIIIYGMVSTGKYWEFAKLKKNIFTQDTRNYSIFDLKTLMSAVDYVFDLAEKEIPKVDASVMLPLDENE